MDPFPDEGEVMDPGVSPQDLSGRTSQQDLNRSNNGAISKHNKNLAGIIFWETTNTVTPPDTI